MSSFSLQPEMDDAEMDHGDEEGTENVTSRPFFPAISAMDAMVIL